MMRPNPADAKEPDYRFTLANEPLAGDLSLVRLCQGARSVTSSVVVAGGARRLPRVSQRLHK